MSDGRPEPKPKLRGIRKALWRFTKWGVGLGFTLSIFGAALGVYGYYEYVVWNPGPHLSAAYIRGVISEETPVFYRDGTTPIGVFFQDEHRQYVPWESIPPAYVVALVAAEDHTYWSHGGVSVLGVARAMVKNAQAGSVVAGGSTLTQQTAKNIYYRPDRSLRSKGQEFLNALRLEAHYSKTDILTFYANQFHVSGNGRGLGIATKYFFNEDVAELSRISDGEDGGDDLVKAAFLAGLVKAPSRYDPFLGNAERQQRSRERAIERTRYVLRRIVDAEEADLIGPWPVRGVEGEAAVSERRKQVRAWKREAQRLLEDGFTLPFERGRFRYDSNSVLDEVRLRLSEPPFNQVLSEANIQDPAKAGLRIVTTLDPDAQREATYALWHHLTDAGGEMEGFDLSAFVKSDAKGPRHDRFAIPIAHTFRMATVTGSEEAGSVPSIELDLGGGHACSVDLEGLQRVAKIIKKAKKKYRYVQVNRSDVSAVVAGLPAGTVVWVSVKKVDSAGVLCDLEARPELQGAVMVQEKGQIIAMVGGNDNRNFNRATALRQFGSTWKPLIFHAALELGWRPDDALDNQRNVFPFSTTFYYPRPDHDPEPVVSMSWAGVNSENLASIWLLYHLTDRLDADQVAGLAADLGLARLEEESWKEYRERINKAGVLPTRPRLREALFLKARREVLLGLENSEYSDDALALESMLYGWGHANELTRVARAGGRDQARKERALRNSYVHLTGLMSKCKPQYESLRKAFDAREAPMPQDVPDLGVLVEGARVNVACGTFPSGYVPPSRDALSPALRSAEVEAVVPQPARPSVGTRLADLLGIGKRETADSPSAEEVQMSGVLPWSQVRLDERIRVETLERLQSAYERRKTLAELEERIDLYDPEYLYWNQDFRVLLALRYVSKLAAEYGVRSKLRPVLSLPLGANEITLEEATAMYAGLTTGVHWSFPGTAWSPGAVLGGTAVGTPPSPALLISEIRDYDDNLLYKAEPLAEMVASPQSASMTADILRNVVLHGTGRRAKERPMFGAAPLPSGGKTGTTNDYKNAAFLGFAPKFEYGEWSPDGAAVGVYVGYDDNRSMRRGRLILAGASGALPAWIGTLEGLVDANLLGEVAESPEDETMWQLSADSSFERVEVDPTAGLRLVDAAAGDEPELAFDTDSNLADEPEYSVLVLRTDRRLVHESEFHELPQSTRVAPSTLEAEIRAQRRNELLDGLGPGSNRD